MNKSILFVGGSRETKPGIIKANNMGLHTIVSDMNKTAPAFSVADDFLIADTYNINASVDAAFKYHKTVRPINGVICLASDVPVTVASIAEKLGLPGTSIDSAILATDKLAMKDQFRADGISVPWYSPVDSSDLLQAIVNNKKYTLVLKPIDSRGARGVLQLTPDIDIDWAYEVSKSYSPTGRVMVEKFLEGPQVSTESIILDGKTYTPGFSDRNYQFLKRYAPFIVENGGELPSFLSEEIQNKVCRLLEKAALSMGIDNWVVKGDIVIHQGKPYIIELAARLSGGYFCTHEIPLSTGVDFVKQAIKLAIGEKVDPADLKPLYQKGVGQRYLFPKPGMVTKICGVEEVKKWPEVALCEVRVKVGDLVKPIENHPGRAGVVITTAETKEEAVRIAEEAVKTIKIETE